MIIEGDEQSSFFDISTLYSDLSDKFLPSDIQYQMIEV